MRLFIRYLFLLFFFILPVNSYCVQPAIKVESEIKKAVEDYCLVEFQGKLMDEERGTLVKYTPDSADYKKFEILTKNSEDDEHLYPYEWDMSTDPFFIVDAYNVVSVKQIDKTHAYAVINYHQLVKVIKKDSDVGNLKVKNFYRDENNITVRLNIISVTKKFVRKNPHSWLVVNPPYPKVSYDAALKYYTDKSAITYKRIQNKYNHQSVTRLTEEYDNYRLILEFLNKLKK